jgi:cellulose synthase operon protein C
VVARHELTHAFNLTQTDYLVPIWLTEGLAVRAEGTKRFDATETLLRDRLSDGTAFTLDTIARGYHNFGSPSDVMLAYHQGYQYVRYIETTHGAEAIARLLDAFRLGLDANDAIRRACGVEKPALEKGYLDHLRALVRGAPRTEKPMTFAELEAAHKKSLDQVDIAARLAAEYARRGKPADARKLVDAVLAKEQGHPGASLVKARLLQRDKDTAGARAVLEESARLNPEDVRVLSALGRLQVERKELDRAAATFEAVRARGGVSLDVLETLAQLHDATKQPDKLALVLEEIAARSPDHLAVRLRLAKLHAGNGGRPEKAEYWAREALFVDVMNEEAHRFLIAALRAQKKDAEVEKLEARYR